MNHSGFTKKLLENIRIIWAITSKDLVDGVKNKNVLGVIIPALFMIVLYRFMPAITAEDGPPALLVYEAGKKTARDMGPGCMRTTRSCS